MRILWVSNHTPFLTDFGGGQRSNLILRALQKIAQVDVLLLTRLPPGMVTVDAFGQAQGILEVVTPTMRGERWPWHVLRTGAPHLVDKLAYNLGRRVVDYTSNPAAQAAFDRLNNKHRYDLFVGRHLKYSGQVGLLNRKNAIIDIDDNEIELFKWIIRDPNTSSLRRFVLKQRVRTLERLLPRLLAQGPQLWVVKDEDRKIRGFEGASVLPNIPYALASSPLPVSLPIANFKPYVLFVGMLSYIYNREGLNWYLRHVWPAIYSKVPNARFMIAGSRLQDGDRLAWGRVPGVEIRGFIADVAEVYRDCAFSVVPVWSGGGTNIKVLESMMYGRTCVLSEPAYRGYSTVFNRRDVLAVARNAEEMINFSLQLLADPGRCIDMGLRGAALVKQQYSYARFQNIVFKTVESALGATHSRS